MNIHCRPIIKSDDIEALVDLHGLIWFTDDRDAMPSHILVALQHAGSLLLGAFDGERIIGFSLAFPGRIGNEWALWSHATGVLPEYQGRGVGKQLKLLQKALAQAQGYQSIRWTYDPLQAGNANFNISQLGCQCNLYHEDFYGPIYDGLNVGLPTDRFEVIWPLTEDRKRFASRSEDIQKAPLGLFIDSQGKLAENTTLILQEPVLRVPIPADINLLRAQNLPAATEWRLITRALFKKLFAAGYIVTDFSKQDIQPGYGTYILHNQQV